jgi:transcriptional regulator of aroF, aroG, tyrA and aromatic amino acid transport
VTICDKAILDVADLELAGARVAGRDERNPCDVASWEEAVAELERGLLERLCPLYPSSRKLAAHLGTSHTRIAHKLRKYRIASRR